MEDARRLMGIIERLMAQEEPEVSVEEIEAVAEREGIESPREALEELVSLGLVKELPGDRIAKAEKRVFW